MICRDRPSGTTGWQWSADRPSDTIGWTWSAGTDPQVQNEIEIMIAIRQPHLDS